MQAGEAIGVVGANGAGKSTLLKILSGTSQASTGTLQVRGRISPILELGMGFNPELNAEANARHALGLMGFSATHIDSLLPGLRDFAEIADAWHDPLRTYSSGMQMRVAFAVVTAVRPDVLIVDEALSVATPISSINALKESETFEIKVAPCSWSRTTPAQSPRFAREHCCLIKVGS